MKDLSSRLSLVETEKDSLENYLCDCMDMFKQVPETQGQMFLGDMIKTVIAQNIYLRGELDQELYEGMIAAYQDCRDVISEIADETEKNHPDNKTLRLMVKSYRSIAAGLQDKIDQLDRVLT